MLHVVADGATVTGRPAQAGRTAHGNVTRMPVGTTTSGPVANDAKEGIEDNNGECRGVSSGRRRHCLRQPARHGSAGRRVEVGAEPQHRLLSIRVATQWNQERRSGVHHERTKLHPSRR
jgi:hypothetical protein